MHTRAGKLRIKMKLALVAISALAALTNADIVIVQKGTGYSWTMSSESDRVGFLKKGKFPTITVPAGEAITFKGKTGGTHYFAVAERTSAREDTALAWMQGQKTFETTVTFETEGDYVYYCPPHKSIMNGKIVAKKIDVTKDETKAPTSAIVACSEKQKCTGSDADGKCTYSKYTKKCQSGPVEKPACEQITNPVHCKMNCIYDKKTSTCAEKTKKPTKAPTEGPSALRRRCARAKTRTASATTTSTPRRAPTTSPRASLRALRSRTPCSASKDASGANIRLRAAIPNPRASLRALRSPTQRRAR